MSKRSLKLPFATVYGNNFFFITVHLRIEILDLKIVKHNYNLINLKINNLQRIISIKTTHLNLSFNI